MSGNIYANRKKRLAGKIAKIEGDNFEESLDRWANKINASLTRVPNGCKNVMIRGRLTLIRIKSCFDFILTKNKQMIAFDAKSIHVDTFARSRINYDQLKELEKIHSQGFKAGYLIYFRKAQKIRFVCVTELLKLKPRESVGIESGIDLGTSSSLNFSLLFED